MWCHINPDILGECIVPNLFLRELNNMLSVCTLWKKACHRKSLTTFKISQKYMMSSINSIAPSVISFVKNTKELILDCSDIEKFGIIKIISTWPNLRKLCIKSFSDMTDKIIQDVSIMQNLRQLHIRHDSKLTDIAMHSISTMTNLYDLILECKKITVIGVHYISTMTNLKKIKFVDCDKLFNNAIEYIFSNGIEKLFEMHIINCKKITNEALQQNLSSMKYLQKLSFSGCRRKISNECLRHLFLMKELRHLDLAQCVISAKDFQYLFAMKHLQHLNIAGCSQLTDEHLIYLSSMPNLEYLNIGNCHKITCNGIRQLSTLDQLQCLDIEECHQVANSCQKYISLMKNLQYLNISRCNEITFINFKYLSEANCLKRLDISYYNFAKNKVSHDISSHHLSSLKNLQYLYMWKCDGLTNEIMQHISNMDELCYLDLSCTKVTDNELQHLSSMKKLRYLNVYKCTKVTNNGLKNLLNMRIQQNFDLYIDRERAEGYRVNDRTNNEDYDDYDY